MKDVMADLETLGFTPGSAILSIGAVGFDPETGLIDDPGFYTVINVHSCVVAGLTFDQSTLDWWAKQSPEARKVIAEAWNPAAPKLADALRAFNAYLARFPDVRVWGNGADFDNPILAAAYRATGVEPGWKPWNGRCFRTLKNQPYAKGVSVQRIGTYHNALNDAQTQALHAMKIFGALRKIMHPSGPLLDFEALAKGLPSTEPADDLIG